MTVSSYSLSLSKIEPEPFDFGDYVPQELLVLLVGLVYATVAPIILPFVVIFFAMGYFVYKYSFVYVFVPEFQTGGKLWPVIFKRVAASLVIYHVTLIGVRYVVCV